MRTFSRDAWLEAQQLWKDGEFSREWREVRHQAAMRGMLYPPDGTKWDSWEDDSPSQRAMLIRAIRETPSMLQEAIAHSKTWGEVIAYLTRRRDEYRELGYAEDRADVEQRRSEPGPRQSVMSIAQILKRIEESA